MTHSRRQFAGSLVLASASALILRPALGAAQDQETPQSGPLADPHPANVFFSPCGRPFRAKQGQPYPVVDWFQMADADSDGKISPQEVQFYEQRIAPEVLGMRVEGASNNLVISARPRLWRVQGIPGGLGPGSEGTFHPGGATGPGGSVDPNTVDTGPDERNHATPYDASGAGASPYGFFDEPEPVTAADIRFRGLIAKADFLKLADIHFSTLDPDGVGFLTLDTLPKTPVQKRLEKLGHGRRQARSGA